MSILGNEAMKSADVADVMPMLEKPTSAAKKVFIPFLFVFLPMLPMLKIVVSNIEVFFFYKSKEREKKDLLGGAIFPVSTSATSAKQQKSLYSQGFILPMLVPMLNFTPMLILGERSRHELSRPV